MLGTELESLKLTFLPDATERPKTQVLVEYVPEPLCTVTQAHTRPRNVQRERDFKTLSVRTLKPARQVGLDKTRVKTPAW